MKEGRKEKILNEKGPEVGGSAWILRVTAPRFVFHVTPLEKKKGESERGTLFGVIYWSRPACNETTKAAQKLVRQIVSHTDTHTRRQEVFSSTMGARVPLGHIRFGPFRAPTPRPTGGDFCITIPLPSRRKKAEDDEDGKDEIGEWRMIR